MIGFKIIISLQFYYFTISDWLASRNEDPAFELKSTDQLSQLLRRFYAEVRSKKGQPYSRSALVSIRASIQRHLEAPPYNCTYSIVSDSIFKPANTIFVSRIKLNRIEGHDTTTHKVPIQEGDIRKMYDSKVLCNDSPKALQYKVFFEMCLHFVRRGKEGLRELRKNSFALRIDDKGFKYVTVTYNEKSKNCTSTSCIPVAMIFFNSRSPTLPGTFGIVDGPLV